MLSCTCRHTAVWISLFVIAAFLKGLTAEEVQGLNSTEIAENVPARPSVAGEWNVTMPGEKFPCLIAKFALRITVPFNTLQNSSMNATIEVPPSANASAESTCSKLVLSWPSASSIPRPPHQLALMFEETLVISNKTNITTAYVKLSNVSAVIMYDPLTFPHATKHSPFRLTAVPQPEFLGAPVNKSYKCDAEKIVLAGNHSVLELVSNDLSAVMLNGTTEASNYTFSGMFDFEKVQIQAMMNSNVTMGQFGQAVKCAEDRRHSLGSRMVPILVASALGALVLVVILAYVIGRRRKRTDYGTVSD